MDLTPFISVIMPALNEGQNIDGAIKDTLASFDRYSINGELLIINDGSTDDTAVKIQAWKEQDSRVRSLDHATPQGIGAAFWDGVDNALGQNVVMLPGDNENDPDEIFQYAGLLDKVDIVIPFLYNREARSLMRNVLSMLYRQIISMTFTTNFNYTNGTILYRRSLLNKLPFRSRGFFFQTDILVRLAKAGYLFAEVPYRIDQRHSGKSKAVSFPSFIHVVKGYINLINDIYFKKNEPTDYVENSATRRRKNGSRL
jgi:glycosyltransferase involved in cell wall biosynthesis